MKLSDRDTLLAMARRDIVIDPFDLHSLQSCSVDLHLGQGFCEYKRYGWPVPLDRGLPAEQDFERFWLKPGQKFYLEPFCAVLAETMESIGLSASMAAEIEGKSSHGRTFLIIHATARYVDAGWCGGKPAPLTFEIVNLNRERSIPLTPGMAISQIVFTPLSSPAILPYGSDGSHYVGSTGVVPSRLHAGYEKFFGANPDSDKEASA